MKSPFAGFTSGKLGANVTGDGAIALVADRFFGRGASGGLYDCVPGTGSHMGLGEKNRIAKHSPRTLL